MYMHICSSAHLQSPRHTCMLAMGTHMVLTFNISAEDFLRIGIGHQKYECDCNHRCFAVILLNLRSLFFTFSASGIL